MHLVCVEFEIAPLRLENFIVAMWKNVAQSFADAAGCQQLDINQGIQNPKTVVLHETYHDDAEFAAHKAAPNYREFNYAIDGMIIKNQLNFCKISATMLKKDNHLITQHLAVLLRGSDLSRADVVTCASNTFVKTGDLQFIEAEHKA